MAAKKPKPEPPAKPVVIVPVGLKVAPEAAKQKVDRHVGLIAALVQGLAIYLMFAPESVAQKIKAPLRAIIANLQVIVGDDDDDI